MQTLRVHRLKPLCLPVVLLLFLYISEAFPVHHSSLSALRSSASGVSINAFFSLDMLNKGQVT